MLRDAPEAHDACCKIPITLINRVEVPKIPTNCLGKDENILTGWGFLAAWIGVPTAAVYELLGSSVYHFVYHDSRHATLSSVSTVLEQKEKPLKSRGLADDSW
jgi:hypothetical protein